MKRCPRCGEVKPFDAFAVRRGRGWQSYCEVCRREYQSGRPRIISAKRLVWELKDNQPCKDCNVQYRHYVLDFDHRPGEKKLANVNVLVKRGATREIILAEIAKCDLVCANCHRIRTWKRKMELAEKNDSVLL
jgi:hypothetical protein